MSDSQGQPRTGAHAVPVITDARGATSVEHDSRVKRYAWTMAFRTACFVSMIFVDGPFRWVLFAGAVFLPYVAVLLANQANQRQQPNQVNRADPIDRPQLTTGPDDTEVISGTITDDEPVGYGREHRDRKVA